MARGATSAAANAFERQSQVVQDTPGHVPAAETVRKENKKTGFLLVVVEQVENRRSPKVLLVFLGLLRKFVHRTVSNKRGKQWGRLNGIGTMQTFAQIGMVTAW